MGRNGLAFWPKEVYLDRTVFNGKLGSEKTRLYETTVIRGRHLERF